MTVKVVITLNFFSSFPKALFVKNRIEESIMINIFLLITDDMDEELSLLS
jgi:hypothetical protein